MPFQLSPGVAVVEKDFSSIVPAVSSSVGAFAGVFQWGPVLDPVTIASENALVQRFGKPNDNGLVHSSFFTAANFLSYTNNLLVVRADSTNAKNAVSSASGSVSLVTLATGRSATASVSGWTSNWGQYTSSPTVSFGTPNLTDGVQATGNVNYVTNGVLNVVVSAGGTGYGTTAPTITFPSPGGSGVTATATVQVTSGVVTGITITNPGSGYGTTPTPTFSHGSGANATLSTVTVGNYVSGVTIVNAGSGYTSAPSVTFTAGTTTATASSTTKATGTKIKNFDDYTTNYLTGQGTYGGWAAKYPGALGNSLKVSIADSATYAAWAYKAEFDNNSYASPLANDEVHVIVIDEDGLWTGTPGSVLEKFAFVSKASDAKKSDGTNNYYRDVVNSQSRYIWWMDHPTLGTNWGTQLAPGGVTTTFASLSTAITDSLTGGVDDFDSADADLNNGFAIFANAELYDISLVLTGRASATVSKYVVDNILTVRKDCVGFISPVAGATSIAAQPILGVDTLATTKTFRTSTLNVDSSYAVLDSGWKYQYDRYSDKYRWIPLNGDVAGLCARTDYTDDPWYSPGGLNRGQIKNVVKLSFNPNKTDRDELYKNGINPVVNFPGSGTVLFGDKTLQSKASAFDRINVRRLFIVLEKAIATAAKYQLFEFNDSFTRAQFKNLVEPFLRDVQGRRGVTDFRVKCDDANNTGEVIDRNEFVADIFIKPNRSINFITLNFVAARSSVSFEEIGA